MSTQELPDGREIDTAENATVSLVSRAEIDQQITTAKKYPRSLKRFRDEALQMVTLTESIAKECIYALPRKDASGSTKTIEGPSARFAEVIASAWGNCRAGARVVGESPEFVTAQGVFYDLERNVAITYEVQRRITNSKGKRYSTDMIGVTANAACSIALRNAILKGVPKAFWNELYAATRKTIAGDVKTLTNRRADAIKEFAIFGVSEAQILAVLEKNGTQDIGVDDLVTLHGLLTAIRDGDSTPEEIFGKSVGKGPDQEPYTDEKLNSLLPAYTKLIQDGTKTPDDIIKTIKSKYTMTAAHEKKITDLAKPAATPNAETDSEWGDAYDKKAAEKQTGEQQ